MQRVLKIVKTPVVVRKNHLFHFCQKLHQIEPAAKLSSDFELVYPCRFDLLSESMLAGGKAEYKGLKYRVDIGDRVGVVLSGGRVVHRSLVQKTGTAAMEGDPGALKLTPGQIYIHWCETVKEYSGIGLYTRMLWAILKHSLTDADFKEALIACRQNNIGSIKGIIKAGFIYLRSSVAFGVMGELIGYSHWYRASCPPRLLPGNRYSIEKTG